MKANEIVCTLALVSLTGFAHADGGLKRLHVPERLDQIRLIQPGAARLNHILVVNVGKAIPEKDWALSSTFAISRLQLNVWTNAIDRVEVTDYVRNPDKGLQDFGMDSRICVFVVDDPKLARFTSAAGHWCFANVHEVKQGKPDAQTLRDRYAKTILKGMAYACGSGATLESACSMFSGSVTNEGMDKTGIMITPMAYFPMLQTLQAIGGMEMLTPAVEE